MARYLQVPDVELLQHQTDPASFVEWNAHLDDVEWRQKTKEEHYLAAIRYDLQMILFTLRRNFLSITEATPPELEDMYINFDAEAKPKSAPPRPPEGHGYQGEGDKGDYHKGYGLPGVEIGKTPLDAKWQQINDNEKLKWQSLMATGLVQRG